MISQEEILELQQEELQRQTAAQSQQATNVDSNSFADGVSEALDIGLDLLTSAGTATLEGACTVASCAGDVLSGTAEAAGEVVGAIAEGIGEAIGALFS